MNNPSDDPQPPPLARSPDEARMNPAPLDYEAPQDQIARKPVHVAGMVVMFITGFCTASCAVIIVSSMIEPANLDSSNYKPPPHHLALAIYAALELIAIGLVVQMIRTPGWRTVARWAALGALLGTGISLLLGGACFIGN
jgi:hypothetical protein